MTEEIRSEVKVPVNGAMESLGIKFGVDGHGFNVSIQKKITEFTSGISTSKHTPATNELFKINNDSPDLKQNEEDNVSSTVATLLYMGATRYHPICKFLDHQITKAYRRRFIEAT